MSGLSRGEVELINAIIVKAAQDYAWSLRYLRRLMAGETPKKGRDGNTQHWSDAAKMKGETEWFFCSGWYAWLTDLNGDYLVERIQKIAGWDEDEYKTWMRTQQCRERA